MYSLLHLIAKRPSIRKRPTIWYILVSEIRIPQQLQVVICNKNANLTKFNYIFHHL